MSNQKITDLSSLPQSSLDAAADFLLLVDSSNTSMSTSGTNVKIIPKTLIGGSINDLVQTWNSGATTFTGFKLNVTDTASNADSSLMDLQVAGSSKFRIKKDGTIYVNGSVFGGSWGSITGTLSSQTDLQSALDAKLSLSGGTLTGPVTGTSQTIEQRNSTNAQRFNLYGTYTDASNYRRLYVSSTTAGAFTIGVEGAGTGASGNSLEFRSVSGVASKNADGSSNAPVVCSEIDFGFNLGLPRKILPQSYGVIIPANSSWDGSFTTGNNAITLNSGISLAFGITGGTDSSILRVGASLNNANIDIRATNGLRVRNQGNTADAAITAASGTFSGTVSTSMLSVVQTGSTWIQLNLIQDVTARGAIIYDPARQEIGLRNNVYNAIEYSAYVDASGNFRVRNAAVYNSSPVFTVTPTGTATARGLELLNSTTSTRADVYNTFTDASNYERGKIQWSSNVLLIGTEKAGTGSARALELQTDGTTRLTISSAGLFTIADASNIAVGTTTGTKIGTATTQKIGFYNKTPVVQPAAVADATDAASVIIQLNLLLSRMRDLGLIAT